MREVKVSNDIIITDRFTCNKKHGNDYGDTSWIHIHSVKGEWCRSVYEFFEDEDEPGLLGHYPLGGSFKHDLFLQYEDNQPIRGGLIRLVRIFIDNHQEHTLYIHCAEGLVRAPTVAIIALVERLHISVDEAVGRIRHAYRLAGIGGPFFSDVPVKSIKGFYEG